MKRYWMAKNNNGEWYSQKDQNVLWKDIENNIVELKLITENGTINLPKNKPQYIQATTCSANLFNGSCEVESRYIGFIENDKKFIIRINEKTNDINVEQ